MSKEYATGEKVLATEMNEIVRTTGLYAASAVGTDAYAITVSPVPDNYSTGDVYRFKADVGNTDGATLNVNTLGAKTIKKNDGEVLDTGDIVAGMIITVQYDGTDFLILSALARPFKVALGSAIQEAGAASNTQTIAHGLNGTPKFVRISCTFALGSEGSVSHGVYDGTSQSVIFMLSSGSNSHQGSSDTKIALVYENDASDGKHRDGVISVDGTNISIVWTLVGGMSAGNIHILWEAFI